MNNSLRTKLLAWTIGACIAAIIVGADWKRTLIIVGIVIGLGLLRHMTSSASEDEGSDPEVPPRNPPSRRSHKVIMSKGKKSRWTFRSHK